ncbi:uncharacterized protein TNCV_3882901 [Trichonephila clavipes]|nr:uncharacterized protein TNCV_3882901 [Trichonephila clavipes]
MELKTEELQEILNEEHQETQRNMSPTEQEEDERGPMSTSAIKDLLKKWEDVRAMVLEWHPYQADVGSPERINRFHIEIYGESMIGLRTIRIANIVLERIMFVNRSPIATSFSKLSRGSLSDEAHFWLNGYVNKQNCRIWSEANPLVYVKTPLHPEKLTVWCALWAGGILLPKR